MLKETDLPIGVSICLANANETICMTVIIHSGFPFSHLLFLFHFRMADSRETKILESRTKSVIESAKSGKDYEIPKSSHMYSHLTNERALNDHRVRE